MRIIKILLVVFSVSTLLSVMSTSCAKTSSTLTSYTSDSASQIITANDELKVSYEFDQVINEAILATTISYIASGNAQSIGNIQSIGNGNVQWNEIPQCYIDTAQIIDSALVRLEYYGKNADGTKGRTGWVTLQLARDGSGHVIPWRPPGAVMNITFQQYEVTVLATNVSIWINGTATVTNITGGQLYLPANITFPPGDSLQDKVSGNISFTYNDNSGVIVTYPWNFDHIRTFNMQNSVLTSTIRGDTAISGLNNISTSGTTRLSYPFYTQITKPVVQSISSAYILSNPLSGEKVINGIPEPITIDYGVNSSGNVVQNNPYGYKMTWTHGGGQAVCVVSY